MEMYIDDIVVFGQTPDDCLSNMERVLKQAQHYGLDIKWSKCHFLKQSINFLGYEIENGQLWPEKEKIKAVKNFPMPVNIRGIQAFLGLTGYFRKIFKDYAFIAKPLTQLLRKDAAFKIEGEQKQAIDRLKAALIEKPVLKVWSQGAKTQFPTLRRK